MLADALMDWMSRLILYAVSLMPLIPEDLYYPVTGFSGVLCAVGPQVVNYLFLTWGLEFLLGVALIVFRVLQWIHVLGGR